MVSLFPLTLEGAELRRRGKRLIGPIDLSLGAEGITIVMGPNGAGKTMLLRLMHGMERLAKGRRSWGVEETEARRRQAFVFQRPVMMRRSVRENLIYPLRVQGVSRAEAKAQVETWLQRVGLAAMADRSASVLSGGERQKLALARALIRAPEIVFLDEPCSNLDGRATREIEALLRDARKAGTRIVMSTHDMGQARRLAEDVLFVQHGAIVEARPAIEFFQAPQTAVARAFLNGDIVE